MTHSEVMTDDPFKLCFMVKIRFQINLKLHFIERTMTI